MRGAIGAAITLAFLASGCNGTQSSVTGPSSVDGNPRFSGTANPATVYRFEERYFESSEGFPLCGGGYATGDITWHETDVWITTPDGVKRIIEQLNIVDGGRAVGPDGTVYIVQQVNQEPHMQLAGQPGFSPFAHYQVRIMLISPGSGENFFYTKEENGKWTGVCRG